MIGRWSENGTSFAKLVEPRMPKTVEVGPIYHNGEAQTKVEAWLQAHGEYAGWRWEGEW